MNRTKVTVACQACQKKKIKCTGSAPCTNCCRTQSNCIFTGTAKKRGPRNGNVEVINSPARRIQILKRDPNLRNKIEQMLANNSNNHHDDDFIQRKRISSSPPNNNENINHLDEVNLHIVDTSKRDGKYLIGCFFY
ncbi:12782_t:CDS:1 [Entrophospora sp. SA101]|nr:1086_t:CDS:1 [Entrophospora sp. SA101]CAJ0645107.1 12782_t:CDS:1 [Entrophospora sp. SA101]CAJ0830084.1 2309_t:CDS:1 [Entrophospora sp. SA101]